MISDIQKQINKINMFSDMVNQDINEYLQYVSKYKEWEREEPLDWSKYPEINNTSRARIKRLMLTQREEMKKLERML